MSQNYKYKRSTTNKFSIKGELSDDGKEISYVDGDKEEKVISVDKCFSKFRGMPIEFSITLKTDEDLSEEYEED